LLATRSLVLAPDEYMSWMNTLAGIGVRLYAIDKLIPGQVTATPTSFAYYAGIAAAQVIATNAVVFGISAMYGGNIGLYAGHHSDYIWRQGDFDPPTDFGLFQLEATADRADVYNNGLIPVITTFGDHTLHHLFPTVDHAYHAYLYKELAETCREFGVRFEFTNYRDMITGFYRSLWRTYRTEHPRRVGWDGKGYKGWVDPNMGGISAAKGELQAGSKEDYECATLISSQFMYESPPALSGIVTLTFGNGCKVGETTTSRQMACGEYMIIFSETCVWVDDLDRTYLSYYADKHDLPKCGNIKCSDLSDFIQRHPGGSEWLTMTKGADITEAFESHHPNIDFIRANILPKYYVRQADWSRESPLTFTPGDFYDTLRSRVRETIRKIGPEPRWWTNFYADTCALLYEGAMGALAFLGPVVVGPGNPLGLGAGWAGAVTLGAGLVGGALVVIGHNYAHMKDNKRMLYVNLANGSARSMRIHHELYGLNRKESFKPLLVFESLLLGGPSVLYLLKPLLLLTRLQVFPADEYLSWLNTLAGIGIRLLTIGRMLQPGQLIASPRSAVYYALIAAAQVITMNTFVYAVTAFYSANIGAFDAACMTSEFLDLFLDCEKGLYAGHHTDYVFRQGDFQIPRDFGYLQLEATADRREAYNTGLLPVITTFGDHTLHHLFPTIDHAYHVYLYNDLRRTCDEFGVRFELTNYPDIIAGFHRSLRQTSRSRFPRRVGWEAGKGYQGWVDPHMAERA
ncbi:Cytochrome b5- protein, partial [Gonapodya sp. JEL0774]